MMELLHAADVPLGLITNGEQWMLVYAPRGETTGFASGWYADIWVQEPITLRAFYEKPAPSGGGSLASPSLETLAAMYEESSKDQQEVTSTSSATKVRQAVEMLIQAFDHIDAESGPDATCRRTGKGVLYDKAASHGHDAARVPFLRG